jgi:hypothetical protein
VYAALAERRLADFRATREKTATGKEEVG